MCVVIFLSLYLLCWPELHNHMSVSLLLQVLQFKHNVFMWVTYISAVIRLLCSWMDLCCTNLLPFSLVCFSLARVNQYINIIFIYVGVIEFLTSGRVPADHKDFKSLAYKSCLQKISGCDKPNEFTHSFKLASAYSEDIMPFTNYTYVWNLRFTRQWILKLQPAGI